MEWESLKNKDISPITRIPMTFSRSRNTVSYPRQRAVSPLFHLIPSLHPSFPDGPTNEFVWLVCWRQSLFNVFPASSGFCPNVSENSPSKVSLRRKGQAPSPVLARAGFIIRNKRGFLLRQKTKQNKFENHFHEVSLLLYIQGECLLP